MVNREVEKQWHNEIGKHIRNHRKAARLSQNDFGQIIGLDQSAVSRMETGKQELSIPSLIRAVPLVPGLLSVIEQISVKVAEKPQTKPKKKAAQKKGRSRA